MHAFEEKAGATEWRNFLQFMQPFNFSERKRSESDTLALSDVSLSKRT